MGFAAALIPAAASVVGGLLNKSAANRQAEGIEAAGAASAARLQPFIDPGVEANQTITNALSGGPGAMEAFQQFQQSTGFQGELEAGQRAVTSSAAARGLLGSGAFGLELQERGQQLAQRNFGNFINTLGSQANRGVRAAGGAASTDVETGTAAAGARAGGDAGFQSGLGQAAQQGFSALRDRFPVTFGAN